MAIIWNIHHPVPENEMYLTPYQCHFWFDHQAYLNLLPLKSKAYLYALLASNLSRKGKNMCKGSSIKVIIMSQHKI